MTTHIGFASKVMCHGKSGFADGCEAVAAETGKLWPGYAPKCNLHLDLLPYVPH